MLVSHVEAAQYYLFCGELTCAPDESICYKCFMSNVPWVDSDRLLTNILISIETKLTNLQLMMLPLRLYVVQINIRDLQMVP